MQVAGAEEGRRWVSPGAFSECGAEQRPGEAAGSSRPLLAGLSVQALADVGKGHGLAQAAGKGRQSLQPLGELCEEEQGAGRDSFVPMFSAF